VENFMDEFTQEDVLAKHLETHSPIIALFYASWCPFCRRFLKVFNDYAEKPAASNYVRVRIDEDENPLWEKYSIEAVPSVLLFKDGKISRRLDCEHGIGLTEEKFKKWLTK
jgi:thioredoxin 1